MTEAFLAEGAIEVGHHETAKLVRLDHQRRHRGVSRDRCNHRHRAGIFLARQGHFHRCSGRRAVVLRGNHRPDAQPDRSRDRHANRTLRVAACRHALRLHPDLQLAVGAAVAILRAREEPPSCSRRRRRTSTTCWRSRSLCSSATTWRASGAPAPSGTPSKCSRGTSPCLCTDQRGGRTCQADFAVAPTFWQHLRRRHLGSLIALFPPYILWAPNAIWKAFDLFVGAIQAFIFALLTILYFSQVDGAGRNDNH